MSKISTHLVIGFVLVIGSSAACSKTGGPNSVNINNSNTVTQQSPATAAATPYKGFTAADIAKLKWIEGSWRGMDGEKPFFERYRFEGTTMLVDSLTDETGTRVEDTSRFELQDGEFGHTEGDKRAAASSITTDAVQFVPVAGGGNSFRFERQTDRTWQAVLEWIDKDKKSQQKIYKMERFPKS